MTKQSAYCAYLKAWAESHSGAGFEGMTPASFDEWLINEGEDIHYDGEHSIAPCDICRDGPTVILDELGLGSRYEPFTQALKEKGINICYECFDAAMEDALQPCGSVVIHTAEGQIRAVFAPKRVTSGFYLEADFDDYNAGDAEQRFDVINNYLRAYSPRMQELA